MAVFLHLGWLALRSSPASGALLGVACSPALAPRVVDVLVSWVFPVATVNATYVQVVAFFSVWAPYVKVVTPAVGVRWDNLVPGVFLLWGFVALSLPALWVIAGLVNILIFLLKGRVLESVLYLVPTSTTMVNLEPVEVI